MQNIEILRQNAILSNSMSNDKKNLTFVLLYY